MKWFWNDYFLHRQPTPLVVDAISLHLQMCEIQSVCCMLVWKPFWLFFFYRYDLFQITIDLFYEEYLAFFNWGIRTDCLNQFIQHFLSFLSNLVFLSLFWRQTIQIVFKSWNTNEWFMVMERLLHHCMNVKNFMIRTT